MVATRGGGTPVKRFCEEQYSDFLRDQYGTRAERRRALKVRQGLVKPRKTPKAVPKKAPKAAPVKKPKKAAPKAVVAKPKKAPKLAKKAAQVLLSAEDEEETPSPKPAPKRRASPKAAPASKPAPTRATPKPAPASTPPARVPRKFLAAKAVPQTTAPGSGAPTRPASKPRPAARPTDAEPTDEEQAKMVADLKELVSTEKRLEIAVVVDGSGSMRRSLSGGHWNVEGNMNFDIVRKCVELLPTAFGARNPKIGVIQFGDHSRVELKLTDDMEQVANAAKTMKFMASGTENGLKPAFADAKKMLLGDRGIKKILFFFTDGGSVGDDVVKLSKQMQDDKTTVVVVGVGVPMDRLSNVASEGLAYRLGSFGKLLEVLGTTY
eukprot:TRINITY_DN33149_c0_g1_i1.p1 TRINITY_DN33149_c0_g1~~TRINITY_DN33149_c0_g1_i1.p1  ORF type:complete len:379 (-),score=63.73 TRINITY_DN33149_c0_g1_i1:63-1199(-)